MTTITYDTDIAAWADEQAWLVRNKRFDLIDRRGNRGCGKERATRIGKPHGCPDSTFVEFVEMAIRTGAAGRKLGTDDQRAKKISRISLEKSTEFEVEIR